MVFIGYEIGSKAYRMYDPVTKRLHVSRDVVFDEEARWNWEAPGESPVSSSFTVEYLRTPQEPASPRPLQQKEQRRHLPLQVRLVPRLLQAASSPTRPRPRRRPRMGEERMWSRQRPRRCPSCHHRRYSRICSTTRTKSLHHIDIAWSRSCLAQPLKYQEVLRAPRHQRTVVMMRSCT